MNISNRKIYYGFTLVELIVVVTIIAILATISFISFSSYTGKSRDSNRLFSIKEISKALEIQKENTGKYPVVDGSYATGGVKISTTDVKLFEVGVVGKNVSDFIKLGGVPLDPKTNGEYLYGLSDDNKHFQLAGTLENEQLSFFIDKAYADGGYNAYVEGNYLGALKFNYNSTDYIANIPSLIFSRKGTYSGGDKYVINGGTNLPYIVDNSSKTGTGATDIEILKQYYGSGAKEEIKSYPIGNIKDKTNIENISKELGIPPIIIAKVVDNKELIVEYSKNTGGTTSNSGDTGGNGNVVYKIDFEKDGEEYTITKGSFTRTKDDKYEGEYSIVSMNKDHNSESCFEVKTDFNTETYIDFNYKVSSEKGYDFLSFYIDGEENFSLSGDSVGWKNYSNSELNLKGESGGLSSIIDFNKTFFIKTLAFEGPSPSPIGINPNLPISAGKHNFKWCYSKDEIESDGSDNIFIDNIVFLKEKLGYNCGIKPNYPNANFFEGYPNQKNQSWSLLNGSQSGCYYKCKIGYGGNDCNTEVELTKLDIMNDFLMKNDYRSENEIYDIGNNFYFVYDYCRDGCFTIGRIDDNGKVFSYNNRRVQYGNGVIYNNTLYFSSYNHDFGGELYYIDNNLEFKLIDINIGNLSSNPILSGIYNDKLIFLAEKQVSCGNGCTELQKGFYSVDKNEEVLFIGAVNYGYLDKKPFIEGDIVKYGRNCKIYEYNLVNKTDVDTGVSSGGCSGDL